MIKPPLRLFQFVALPLFAIPAVLLAQAAAEYALKAAQSPVSASRRVSVAGCQVDSDLLTCLSHSYPRTTVIVLVVVFLLVVRSFYAGAGYSR